MTNSASKKSFPILILTTFLNTVGIGILIPVLPFLIEKYTGSNIEQTALYTGIITALYALCEFFAAPTLGALSDKFGRRPVLLISLLGSAFGYLLLGYGGALWILFLGRIIDGLTAGNISTVFAYVADITEPEERGKYYGIIGGTLGLGFMIGPAIGGFTASLGLSVPMFIAAGVTLINVLWAYFALPESLQNKSSINFTLKNINPFSLLFSIGSNIFLRTILFASFFHFIAFAQLQGNGSVLFKDALHWNASNIGIAFLVVGLVDIITQGFLMGKLLPIFGENKLSKVGLFIVIFSYVALAFLPITHSQLLAYSGLFLFAFGTGLFEPSMASLVSQSADDNDQGMVQGAYQSLQSLTRVIGPITAAFMYNYNWSSPYIVCAILTIISISLFVKLNCSK
jgi:MFS transporter, DHA1 family, tetracycline resistance protein